MELEVKYLVVGGLDQVEKVLLTEYPEILCKGVRDLPAIYYDTLDGRLEQGKSALRVRVENGQLVGCFKATTEEKRKFVEEEILLISEDLDSPWYSRLENYAEIQRLTGGKDILPLVKIETKRTVFVLKMEELVVEIALDFVNYLNGIATEERVEVELKEGDSVKFFEYIEKFDEIINGLQETHVSKYQRARDLLRGSV